MTTTYDPYHPAYFDEGDLRDELARVFDICSGCRRCTPLCGAFPTLFASIDALADQDAARLSPAQQDEVVGQCFDCTRCVTDCPYSPGHGEGDVDVPRLVRRARAVQFQVQPRGAAQRFADAARRRPDLVARLGARGDGGARRSRAVARVVGLPADGLPAQPVPEPATRVRFSTWFRARRARGESESTRMGRPGRAVALFPTCIVEHHEPAVGQDLVKVLEHNGIRCELPAGERCCGAPLLQAGDVDGFVRQAGRNVEVLAREVRAGRDVVVGQPTCGTVLRHDYPDHLGTPDAHLVASHTRDAAELLWSLHQAGPAEFDTEFPAGSPSSITYHAPCRLQGHGEALASVELLRLTGAEVTVVAGCAARHGPPGVDPPPAVAHQLASAIDAAGGGALVGDCSLANGGILQETGRAPVHPVQILARAYGIAPEPAGREPER